MSALTPSNKALLIGLCSMCLGATYAQTQNVQTLGDMINQAKRKQELSMNAMSDPQSTGASKRRAPVEPFGILPPPNNPPLLWTLTGVNNQLVAEVIYQESVHVLRLSDGDREIGPWRIERFSPNGLYLVSSDPRDNNKKKGLFLAAPMPGTSLDQYSSSLPTTATSPTGKQRSPSRSELAVVEDLTDNVLAQMLQEANINRQPPSTRLPPKNIK